MTEVDGQGIRVVETELDGTRAKIVFRQDAPRHPAVDIKRGIAVGVNGLSALQSRLTTPIPRAASWAWPMLLPAKPWVVSEVVRASNGNPKELLPMHRVEVFDLTQLVMLRRVEGYSPSVAPTGAVLHLTQRPDRVDVMRLIPGQPKKLKTIRLSEAGPYAVTEVVAFTANEYVYRVYDEHEYRYFDHQDRPFYPGPEGQWKEQFNLVVSGDRRWTAFTERDWNALTYLVVVDLKRQKRIQLPYHGSFPIVTGGWVLFVSDPRFVTSEPRDFEQISDYALYAYDLASANLCRVARYPYPVAPYPVSTRNQSADG